MASNRSSQEKLLRPHGGDDAVDAEPLLLEAHAAGVDVPDPDALRRDLPHQETGDPAIAAGEVEQLADPAGIAEAPAQDLSQRAGDARAGPEVLKQGPLAVSLLGQGEEAQHLVAGVDGSLERLRGDLQIGEESVDERAFLVGAEGQGHGGGSSSFRRRESTRVRSGR